jgi:hypothetical protein
MLRAMRRALGRLLAIALVVAAVIAVATPAHADEIDDQVALLAGGGGYKIRLGAALSLSKSSDGRAVTALAVALERDGESTIRRVAALALGQLGSDVAKKARDRAQAALEKAARADKDARVRDTAAATRRPARRRCSSTSAARPTSPARRPPTRRAASRPRCAARSSAPATPSTGRAACRR